MFLECAARMGAMVVPETGRHGLPAAPHARARPCARLPGKERVDQTPHGQAAGLREVSTHAPPYPVRVTLPGVENFGEHWSVVPGMRPINDAHVTEPGLAVVEVAAADDKTAFAIQELLATQCAVAAADRTIHEPGEPGVRLRCYLDLRQQPDA